MTKRLTSRQFVTASSKTAQCHAVAGKPKADLCTQVAESVSVFTDLAVRELVTPAATYISEPVRLLLT